MAFAVLAALVDLVHALAMAVWVVGLPLLFARAPRWRRWRRGFAYYAIGFVVVSQISQAVLGECFLTTLVRPLWERGGYAASSEWFTVRVAQWVFGMIPSHRAISRISEALVVLTAAGALFTLAHERASGAKKRPEAA